MRARDVDKVQIDDIYSIEVVDDEYTDNLGGQREDDEWSRDSYSTSHNIVGFKSALDAANRYYDLTVPYRPEDDETYYVLFAVWTTGDSFGRDPGRGIEYIGFYTADQLDVANENMRKIEKDDSSRSEGFSVTLKTPDGKKTFKQSCGWKGYFESLDYVDIASVNKINV